MPDKKQIGPRVSNELAQLYDWYVRANNDGKRRGKLGEEARWAFLVQVAYYCVRHPESYDELKEEQPELAAIVEEEAMPLLTGMLESTPLSPQHEYNERLDSLDERTRRIEDMLYTLIRATRGDGQEPEPSEDFRGLTTTGP